MSRNCLQFGQQPAALDTAIVLANHERLLERRPGDVVFRAGGADMETVFVLITNGNLNFELGHCPSDDCGQRQHHRDDVEICFMHTPSIKQRLCQPCGRINHIALPRSKQLENEPCSELCANLIVENFRKQRIFFRQ